MAKIQFLRLNRSMKAKCAAINFFRKYFDLMNLINTTNKGLKADIPSNNGKKIRKTENKHKKGRSNSTLSGTVVSETKYEKTKIRPKELIP